MPRRVRFSPLAKSDVSGIKRWTRKYFGPEQVVAYLKLMNMAISEIGEEPDTPRARKVCRHGEVLLVLPLARKGRGASHCLVYRMLDSGHIEIIRVLHEKMDQSTHLPEDYQP